jgi:uncharacterized membrane protein
MNAAYLHLLTNHIPVFGFLFGVGLLAYGMVRGNAELKRLAAFVLLLAAIGTVVAYYTGHGAEEMVEHFPGVMEEAIDEHEEAARLPFYLSILSGIVAAVYLLRPFRFGDWAMLLLSVLSLGGGVYAAKTGGAIRHAAEQGLTTSPNGGEREGGGEEKEREEEDDD